MTAWAAETAAQAAEAGAYSEPWYASPDVWVAVAFICFVALVGRIAYKVIAVALDDRAERIRSQIDEAVRIHAEAQELLASYELKQREAAQEAENIIEDARREADRIAEKASEDLDNALKRREHMAMERIAQAEAAAVAEVRTQSVELAMAATEILLAKQIKGKHADALIDSAIGELADKLKPH